MQQAHALANTVSKILQHRRKVSPHSFSIVRETDSSAEAVGSVCKRDRTRVLISPSSLRRLENNHSLPSNILSIRQSSSSHPYTGARRSHYRERWGVNRMGSLPPPPHLYPQFSPIYSSRQVQFYVIRGTRCQDVCTRSRTDVFISDASAQHLQEYIESFCTVHIFRFPFSSLTRVGD